MDSIPPGLFSDVGAVAVVLVVGWMIFTGRLVTRREADDIRRDRDNWRAAWSTSELAREVSASQTGELLQYAKVSEELLRGIVSGGRQ